MILKYNLQRKNSSDDKSEDDMDEDGLRESKTTVTIQLDPADATSTNPQVFHRVSSVNIHATCRGKGLESLCRLPRQKKTAKTAKIRPKTGQFLAKFG